VADSPSKKKITDNSPKKPEFLRARYRDSLFCCRPAAVLSFCVPARAASGYVLLNPRAIIAIILAS